MLVRHTFAALFLLLCSSTAHAQSAPPAPWSAADVGAVGAAGSTTVSGGAFTVTGAGADIWGTADAFQFAWQPMSGDGEIVARVASVQNVHAWTKAGVMIRQALSANSAHAMMIVSPGKGTAFQRRVTSSGTSTHTAGPFVTAPYWVRLVRAGNTFSAYTSANGSTWALVGSEQIAMTATVYAGLAVTSHVAGTRATAVLDGVTVTETPAPPPPPPPPGSGGDVVLYASRAPLVVGRWSAVADSTAAGGARLQNPNLGAAKITAARTSPSDYFELTFDAEAGRPYHLWIRGKATSNSWANDSTYVQFDRSVNASGVPAWRIGTTDAAWVSLEECTNCGISGWGWQDNGYGAGVLGDDIYFAATGTQRLRVQVREDGLGVDQIVLSPATYLSAAPGAQRNDSTILPASGGGGTAPPPVTVVHAPYVQQVTATSAIVVWSTREAGTARVRYRTGTGTSATAAAASALYPASRTGMGDFYQHVARLSGLAASTAYTYDVELNGVDPIAGSDRLVTAPPDGTGSISFIAFGDSGTGSTAQQQLAATMRGDSFDLALHAGDLAYGSSDGLGAATHRTTTDWFFAVYRDWLSSSPMFPSMGNHDSRAANNDGRPYLDLFVLPPGGGSGAYANHAERYYSFDYGPVHFVALDTELAFQDTARRAEQLAWLEADLAASSAPWTIAYFHRSPFTAGGQHGSDLAVRAAFAPLFERYGVQLVISSHEHVYERTKPWRTGTTGSPVTYIVTGGGGGPLYAAGSAAWTAVSGSFHHYVKGVATTCTLTVDAVLTSGAKADSVTLNRCQ